MVSVKSCHASLILYKRLCQNLDFKMVDLTIFDTEKKSFEKNERW